MHEILPNVWLGDKLDAYGLRDNDRWKLICVLEQKPPEFKNTSNVIWLPVLSIVEGEQRAPVQNLNRITNQIDSLLRQGFKVLIFCGAGLERSPLAVAWYIHLKFFIDEFEAYNWILKFRHVSNKTDWILE